MKDNTKTTTSKTASKAGVQGAHEDSAAVCKCQSAAEQENEILKRSILVTSLLINLFFLVSWVVVASNSDYAHAIGRAIYNI